MDYSGQGTSARQNNTVSSIAYKTAADPIESSPARNQIGNAEQYMSDMHSALDRLESRLDTILTPVPPDVNKTNGSPTPMGPKSHVVGRLETLNDGLLHVVARIDRLNARVEL